MALHITTENAFHTAGAGKALTTSFVAGDEINTQEADTCWFSAVIGGTAPTQVQWYPEWSDDGGTTYHRHPAVNTVSTGTVDYDRALMEAPINSCGYGPFSVPPGAKLRVQALRVGGAADTTLLGRFQLSASAVRA